METIPNVHKRRGPKPGPVTVKSAVLIPPELLEWGKAQPRGLSETVRRLMAQEQARQDRAAARKGGVSNG